MSHQSTQKQCHKCGHMNRRGMIFCESCGTQISTGLPPEERYTRPITPQIAQQLQEMKGDPMDTLYKKPEQRDYRPGTSVFDERMVLHLEIEGSEDPLVFRPFSDRAIIFGRVDPDDTLQPDIDLVPFGGHRRGISRRHAAITLSGKRLDIRDLDSSNGTFLNDVLLDPKEPHQLRDGDEVRLGEMAFKIRFER